MVSRATAGKGPPLQVLLDRYMFGTVAGGIVKIAVVVNLKAGDQPRQFTEGCVWEGRSMGFIVDVFVTGGDEQRCRDLLARIAQADYDGLVFSNSGNSIGDDALSYDTLKPVADRGMRIVTFEASPSRGGRIISGINETFQDDSGLARLSLDTLISCGSGDRPPKIIRIGTEAGIPFMVRRNRVFDDYLSEGKIEEVGLINLRDLENPEAAARELASVLSRFPPGTVDAVWSPFEECAAGCVEALAAAGREDIKLFSIGISNEGIRLMQRYSRIWLASAAVDLQLAGTVNMRILAARLAGEIPPATFSFGPQLVMATDLNRDVNMGNISVMVPGWEGGSGLFDDYPWMEELKTVESRYLRIAPFVQAAE